MIIEIIEEEKIIGVIDIGQLLLHWCEEMQYCYDDDPTLLLLRQRTLVTMWDQWRENVNWRKRRETANQWQWKPEEMTEGNDDS